MKIVYVNRPESAPPQQPIQTSRVARKGCGDILLERFKSHGFVACGSCMNLAHSMNVWGVKICHSKLDYIVDNIIANAKVWQKSSQASASSFSARALATLPDLVKRPFVTSLVLGVLESSDIWTVPTVEPRDFKFPVAITCYYNPCGYQRLQENYLRFEEGLESVGLPLYKVELAFDDQPFWKRLDADLKIRGSQRNLMWQKERLLNLLIKQLPEDVDAIAWIDADILFLNKHWVDGMLSTLKNHNVVQLWEDSHHLLPDGNLSHYKRSTAWAYSQSPATFTDFRVSHPGYAWAARADWLRERLLLDNCPTGGGDSLVLKGLVEDELPIESYVSEGWRISIQEWAGTTRQLTRGSLGYVPGAILHLYHGSVENRRYMQRWKYLTDHNYDPHTDIEIDPENGLLRWTDFALKTKPEMVKLVAGYFAERREDD